MIARLGITPVLSTLAMATGAVADMASKKAALIEAMNENCCMMTTAQSNIQMPKLGITRPEAIKLSREMMAEDIAQLAADEETLLLLPPARKK